MQRALELGDGLLLAGDGLAETAAGVETAGGAAAGTETGAMVFFLEPVRLERLERRELDGVGTGAGGGGGGGGGAGDGRLRFLDGRLRSSSTISLARTPRSLA